MAWLRLPRRSLRPVGRSVPTPTLTTCHPVLLHVSSRTLCRTCRQDTSHRPQTLGGGVKSLGRLGRVTARGLTQRFFLAPGGFELFSQNQKSNGPSANRSQAIRAFSRRWTRRVWALACQSATGRAFIFQARWGGAVKSLGSSRGDRAGPAR